MGKTAPPEQIAEVVPEHLQKSVRWRLRIGERQTLLVFGDLLISLISLLVGIYIWASGDLWLEFSLEFIQARVQTWFYLLPFIWMILLVELYDIRRASDWQTTVRGILIATIVGLILYSAIYFFSQKGSLPRRGVAGFIVSSSMLTLAWRYLYIQIFTRSQFVRQVLLVGAGETGIALLRVINEHDPPPFSIVGIIDDDPDKHGKLIENYPVLGGCERLSEVVAEATITELLVAISGDMQSGMFQALLDAQEKGVELTRMPVAYEELWGRVPIHYLEADWIVRSFVDQVKTGSFYELGKRLADILGGMVGVAGMMFFLPFIAIATLLETGRPIFYLQTRAGQGGRPYKMIKFRTMHQDAEADGRPQWATENDIRATHVGRFLRKTHLDELPQFINVLRGEMSLVGPRAERPELVEYFQVQVPFYRARLIVKPGITGWAQINFGYAVTVDDTAIKLEYDLYYIKHRNILLDLVIILRTVGAVIGFRGR